MKSKFESQENEINNLISTINYLSNEISKYKSILKSINILTDPFKVNNCIQTYSEVINSSFLLPQTKKEYLSFFQAYERHVIDKNREKILSVHKQNTESKLLNLYSPENAWDFIMKNQKLSRSTKNKD